MNVSLTKSPFLFSLRCYSKSNFTKIRNTKPVPINYRYFILTNILDKIFQSLVIAVFYTNISDDFVAPAYICIPCRSVCGLNIVLLLVPWHSRSFCMYCTAHTVEQAHCCKVLCNDLTTSRRKQLNMYFTTPSKTDKNSVPNFVSYQV